MQEEELEVKLLSCVFWNHFWPDFLEPILTRFFGTIFDQIFLEPFLTRFFWNHFDQIFWHKILFVCWCFIFRCWSQSMRATLCTAVRSPPAIATSWASTVRANPLSWRSNGVPPILPRLRRLNCPGELRRDTEFSEGVPGVFKADVHENWKCNTGWSTATVIF